jgi:hypothetical protein
MSSGWQFLLKDILHPSFDRIPRAISTKHDNPRIFLESELIGVLMLGGNSQSGDTSHLSQT